MKYILLLATMSILGLSCQKDCDCDQPDPDPVPDNCKLDLGKGLVAYYPFNGNFNDVSGNGLNGIAKNGATLGSDYIGRPDSAASFDGADDYVIVPGNSKLDLDSFTIAFQVMVTNNNRRNVTISRINYQTSESLSWGIHQSQASDNKFSFGVMPGTDPCNTKYPYAPNNTVYPNITIQPYRWYNIIASFSQGKQLLYINGVLEGSTNKTFSNAKKCPGGDLMIGGWWSGDIVSIAGKIDEVRLYNRTLTACEINKLSAEFK